MNRTDWWHRITRFGAILSLAGSILLIGCTTLPSCAWGKCAYPRSPALIPQMNERVYPLEFDEIYQTVKQHLEQRGYPFLRAEQDILETEPYAEKEFARFLGLQYRWQVQVRRMDRLNTAVLPRLFLHEQGKPPRELSPGLWPEPYRYFYHEIERSLLDLLVSLRVDSQSKEKGVAEPSANPSFPHVQQN